MLCAAYGYVYFLVPIIVWLVRLNGIHSTMRVPVFISIEYRVPSKSRIGLTSPSAISSAAVYTLVLNCSSVAILLFIRI
jgi:hypothetical protein